MHPRSSFAEPRIPAVDSLRGLAIVLLVLGHYVGYLSEGWGEAVTARVSYTIVMLFVVTGYVVTELVCREFDRSHTVSLESFVKRKLIRVYPTVFAVLVFFGALHYLGGNSVPPLRFVTFGLFVGNYYNGLAVADELRYNVGHLWSISVGAQFFLLFLPLLAMALRSGTVRRLAGLLLAVAAVSFGVHGVLYWGVASGASWAPAEVYVYNATETRIGELAVGAWLALALREGLLSKRLLAFAGSAAGVTLASLIVVAGFWPDPTGLRLSLFSVVMVGALLAGLQTDIRMPAFISRPLHGVSILSYSMFAWHVFAIGFYPRLGMLPEPVRVPSVLLLVVIMSLGAYVVLEMPFRRWAVK